MIFSNCDNCAITVSYVAESEMIPVEIVIDYYSRTPVYEQIKEQIISLINSGELKTDDKLPSMRQLSSQLDLNVNTVKRALAELEDEQVTYSVPGKGVFVSEKAVANKIVFEKARDELVHIMLSAKARGITKEDMQKLTDEIFGGDNND